MRKKEVFMVFRQLGWSVRADDGFMKLEDRIVWISAAVKDLAGYRLLDIVRAVSTELFCEFTSEIAGVRKTFWRMTGPGTGDYECYRQDFTYRDFEMASEQAVEWAYAQDLDSRLAELGSLPLKPFVPFIWYGNYPVVDYLAVLAMNGDCETLRRYRLMHERGEPLDFLPLVEKEYLDRALALAEAQASGTERAPSAWHQPRALNSALRHRRSRNADGSITSE